MYRSLYDYVDHHSGDLPVRTGEQFRFIEQHDENWWKVRSQSTGRVGLVPACYLEAVDAQTTNPSAEMKAVLESVDRAIETIHAYAARAGGTYTLEQRANLRKLLEHRKVILSGRIPVDKPPNAGQSFPAQPRRPAPTCPPDRDKLKTEEKKTSAKRRQAPSAPSALQAGSSFQKQEPPLTHEALQTKDTHPGNVRAGIAAELLELLRINTGLSYEKSFVAVNTVVSHIQESVPAISEVMAQILHDLVQQKEGGKKEEDTDALLGTHDGQQLIQILNKLTEHKDDSQQRSWAVHEDEGIILKLVKNLLSILLEADPAVCRAVLRQDDYEYVHMLVVFYQMEERLSLRHSLIEVFGCMCGLEKAILTQLLCHVLPSELARDIMTRKDEPSMQCHCAILLTMILSTGEPVPFTLYDQMNESFVDFVVAIVEDAGDSESGERLVDALVPLILAFNQHFVDFKSNIVMASLASRGSAKTLSERIMLLVNREEDPVKMFDYPRTCPDSVLKFLADIFSSRVTSGFFYTSDMMVLLEIVLRQLADLSPGNKMRTEYLSILHQILTNSNYNEHKHKAGELSLCLKRIREEEDDEAEQDKLIVKEILETFSAYFS